MSGDKKTISDSGESGKHEALETESKVFLRASGRALLNVRLKLVLIEKK
jgi:hypothetical protein